MMAPPLFRQPAGAPRAFSLVEMAAVLAIATILLAAGARLLHGTGAHSRRAATDLLTGMIDQAATAAITSRCYVVLAVAGPADSIAADPLCRVGLFRVESWPDAATDPIQGAPLGRWRFLQTGIALIPGEIDGHDNPLDGPKLSLSYQTPSAPVTLEVHAIAFHPHGGLHYPPGSRPLALRVAEAVYQNGGATPLRRGPSGAISGNCLKIGRVNPRPYRTDG